MKAEQARGLSMNFLNASKQGAAPAKSPGEQRSRRRVGGEIDGLTVKRNQMTRGERGEGWANRGVKVAGREHEKKGTYGLGVLTTGGGPRQQTFLCERTAKTPPEKKTTTKKKKKKEKEKTQKTQNDKNKHTPTPPVKALPLGQRTSISGAQNTTPPLLLEIS